MAGRLQSPNRLGTRQRGISRVSSRDIGPTPSAEMGAIRGHQDRHGVNIDFMNADSEIKPQHYAFLVSEAEFDEIFGRIRERALPY